mmetsp:Transcript_41380/g.104337  ORF Transcript_41380/g.104337 Transcript_41380/m.104337 type:complete len:404 (+) Transcript_41380:329-1540(+)
MSCSLATRSLLALISRKHTSRSSTEKSGVIAPSSNRSNLTEGAIDEEVEMEEEEEEEEREAGENDDSVVCSGPTSAPVSQSSSHPVQSAMRLRARSTSFSSREPEIEEHTPSAHLSPYFVACEAQALLRLALINPTYYLKNLEHFDPDHYDSLQVRSELERSLAASSDAAHGLSLKTLLVLESVFKKFFALYPSSASTLHHGHLSDGARGLPPPSQLRRTQEDHSSPATTASSSSPVSAPSSSWSASASASGATHMPTASEIDPHTAKSVWIAFENILSQTIRLSLQQYSLLAEKTHVMRVENDSVIDQVRQFDMNGILPQLLAAVATEVGSERRATQPSAALARASPATSYLSAGAGVLRRVWSQLSDMTHLMPENPDPNTSLTLGVAITAIGASLLYRLRE